MCPTLVRVVRQSGLLCFSYGTLNNEPKNVARQAAEGIDAVIVDSVLAVRKGLTASEQAAAVARGMVGEAKEAGEEVREIRIDVGGDGHGQGMNGHADGVAV